MFYFKKCEGKIMKKNILKVVFVFILVALCTIMLFGCELLGSNKNENKNNGSTNSGKEYTIMYSDGKTVHRLNVKTDENYSIDFPLPQKEGYTFMGLFDAEFGGTQYVSSTGISVAPYTDNRNITLFPQFSVNEYTFKLDYGESTGVGRSLKVRYGDNMPDLPGNLTIDGQYYMNFVGWFVGNIQITGSDGMSYDLLDNQIIKYSDAENVITLKAKFEKQSYNVDLFSEDGRIFLGTVKIPHGESIMKYCGNVISNSKTVVSWSSQIKGEVFEEKVTSDLVLYAIAFDKIVFNNTVRTGSTKVAGSGAYTLDKIQLNDNIDYLKKIGLTYLDISISFQIKENDDCYQRLYVYDEAKFSIYKDETFSHGGGVKDSNWGTYEINCIVKLDDIKSNIIYFKCQAENKIFKDFFIGTVKVKIVAH